MLRARLLSYYLPMHKLLGSKQENGNIVFQYLPGWPVLKGALLSCPVEDMMLVENHGIQNSTASKTALRNACSMTVNVLNVIV